MIPIPALQRAVEERYGCFVTLREILLVAQRRADGSTWEGPVAAFNLVAHPESSIAYAWYGPGVAPRASNLHVVRHADPIDSAAAAVASEMSAQERRATEQAS
jgi:hypothetical protein